MPQFDITTYSAQLFWLFLNFVLLLSVLGFFVLPRYRKGFHLRQESLAKDQEVIDTLLDEIETYEKAREGILLQLKEEMGRLRNEKLQSLRKQKDDKFRDLEASLQKLREKEKEKWHVQMAHFSEGKPKFLEELVASALNALTISSPQPLKKDNS